MKFFKDKLLKPIKTPLVRPGFGFAAFIVLLTLFAYLPAFQNEFLNWDDNVAIVSNTAIRAFDWEHIKLMLTQKSIGVYAPLTELSFAVEYHFFKLDPFFYHFHNVILHLLNTILVFGVCRHLGLTNRASFVGTLIFGIHPIHVESVAWAVERKDVLFAFFYLCGIISYCSYLKDMRKWKYAFVILFGVLSILSKAMAYSYPLILFLIDWFKQRPINRRAIFEKIPLFVIFSPILIYTLMGNTYRYKIISPLGQMLLSFLWSSTFYLRQFFCPLILLPIYPVPGEITIFNPEFLLAFWIAFFVIVELVTRKNRLLTFAFAFYFFFMILLFRFSFHYHINFVADRFMYLSCLGFCVAIGSWVDNIFQKKNRARLKRLIFWMIIILLFSKTSLQNKIWKDGFHLWDYIIDKYPSSIALNNRGILYRHLGKMDLALRDQSRAQKLSPTYSKPYFNMGLYFNQVGMKDLAIENFSRAILYEKGYLDAHRQRGIVYGKIGKYDLALQDFKILLLENPKDSDALANIGLIYYSMKEFDKALLYFNKAIEINPANANGLTNRGLVYLKKKDYAAAIRDFTNSISIFPGRGENYFQRSFAYFALNDLARSKLDLKRAQIMGVRGSTEVLREIFSE